MCYANGDVEEKTVHGTNNWLKMPNLQQPHAN